jgi:leucyl/phenylalanyl-tRNA--protein transferase
MVLATANFRLRRSLRQAITRFVRNPCCEIRFDSNFASVISACASSQRRDQPGTWILPAIVHAYTALHHAGHAHSIEAWMDGQLVGGLYCVCIGRAVFGESMFSHASDASKVALAALVGFCRAQGIALIDCQQNTAHLASLGAHEVPRMAFLEQIERARQEPPVKWHFSPLYWKHILSA